MTDRKAGKNDWFNEDYPIGNEKNKLQKMKKSTVAKEFVKVQMRIFLQQGIGSDL